MIGLRDFIGKLRFTKQNSIINEIDEINRIIISQTSLCKCSYPILRSRWSLVRLYYWISMHKYLSITLVFICMPILIYLVLLLLLPYSEVLIPKQFSQHNHSRLLLVVAHPDDECLFFSPTIRVLKQQFHVNISLLVISRGNHQGMGHQRAMELYGSCRMFHIPKERCISLDLAFLQDDPTVWWSEQHLIPVINEYIHRWSINVLVSFDFKGISGHINHRSLAFAVRQLIKRQHNSIAPMSYELKTVSIFRKYLPILDFYLIFISVIPRLFHSLLSSLIPFGLIPTPNYPPNMLLINTPYDYVIARHAFANHQSQYSWDRYIYLVASRYMFVNELIYTNTYLL